MSAGPDELHLREFREVSELISDPLQAFFEEAQATDEVLKGQNGSAGTGQTYKQSCSTTGEASPTLGTADRSITWEKHKIIQSCALQG